MKGCFRNAAVVKAFAESLSLESRTRLSTYPCSRQMRTANDSSRLSGSITEAVGCEEETPWPPVDTLVGSDSPRTADWTSQWTRRWTAPAIRGPLKTDGGPKNELAGGQLGAASTTRKLRADATQAMKRASLQASPFHDGDRSRLVSLNRFGFGSFGWCLWEGHGSTRQADGQVQPNFEGSRQCVESI